MDEKAMDDLVALAELVKARNAVASKIAALIKRPALIGHVGEFIASRVFEIDLEESATQKGFDGSFKEGTLRGCSVNIKWYAKQEGVLDMTPPALPDYYLVLAGPRASAESSCGMTRPWAIEAVYLFNARELAALLESRNIKVGVGTSVRQGLWSEAEIYPTQRNTRLVVSNQQRELLALFQGGAMATQYALECAINRLVNEFLREPYTFFTEADAVARFHQILDDSPILGRKIRTRDNFEVGLVHREYPTFFRFSDKNPTARLGPPAHRGHYDTVILNPEFVAAHPAATVINRDITTPRDECITPLQAAVEFKLDNQGWSKEQANGAIAELGKLSLSGEAPLRYFVVLMRYCAPTLTRWRRYWPMVRQAAKERPEIHSIFATSWLTVKGDQEVCRFGDWLEDR